MDTLIVAEKPSVAADIARVLGAQKKGKGFYTGGGYTVSWALGHLVTLCDPGEVDPSWKKWQASSLPMLPKHLPTKVIEKTKAQYEILKSLLLSDRFSSVVCATDAGREGELIFRLIYRQAGCKKPVQRLWISSMTDQAIQEGFAHLRPGSDYDALYASAKCRSIADWLVGMNASRAYTLRYDTLLSLGRVQTPTLALIVRRDREIADFTPTDYYEVRAQFTDYTGLWVHPHSGKTRTEDKKQAEAVCAAVSGQEGVVKKATQTKKRLPPPRLYDLTTLQREANSRYGFSAKKTLDLAQALYERHKLITYPRTDSPCLPTDMKGQVVKVLKSLPPSLAEFVAPLLPTPPAPKRVYDNSRITDHHAIIPTGVPVGQKKLTADEGKLFDLIARRLVAALLPDYEYLALKVETLCAGHLFRSTGNVPVTPGWKALYPDRKKAAAEEASEGDEPDEAANASLPPLQKGDHRPVTKADVLSRKTQPPPHLTAATLLAQMEQAGRTIDNEELRESMKDAGLGTPATRAAIIERLKQVGYITEQGKKLLSTEKGRMLISVVPKELSSAETTGRWERALNKMARAASAEEAAPLYGKFLDSIGRYCTFLVEYSTR